MTKLLLAVLSAAVLGAGGIAAATGLGGFEPAPVVSLPAASTTTTGTTTTNDDAAETEDVRGPCDEAEHRNDPRCAGTAARTTVRDDDDNAAEAEDVRGPCDEAEHANDPRCTGAAPDDDNSGPGTGTTDDNHTDDDRSGSNSGKG
jgi:hypothetical protein